jgi:hypothetical protein
MKLFLTNVSNSNWPQLKINQFVISTVELVNNQQIKIWFSRAAKYANVKTNYSLSGSSSVNITLAQYSKEVIQTTEVDSKRIVNLYLDQPITVGQWTLSLTNIVSYDTEEVPLPTNSTVLFDIVEQQELDLNEQNSINILNFIPRRFRDKKVLSGILESIEQGDKIIQEQSRFAFDQYFVTSATGDYLTTRAGDQGVPRIPKLGINDSSFSTLATNVINNKLTSDSISSILECMYGTSSVSAYVETALAEPYQLFHNADLGIQLNNVNYTYIVNLNDFTNPINVSALELTCNLNLFFEKHNIPAKAEKTLSNKIRIYNKTKASNSTVSIIKGTLQPYLQFDTPVFGNLTFEQASTQVWGLTNPRTGIVRFTQTSGTLNFSRLMKNDYVTITGTEFPEELTDSWTITAVNYTFTPSMTCWFEIESDYVISPTYSSVSQVYQKSLYFFRPVKKRVQDDILWSSVTQIGGKSKVSIPATSRAVQRNRFNATYLKPPFYTVPSVSLTTPPSSRATRLLQNYNNKRTVTVYNASLVNAAVTSDGNLSTIPTIAVGDTLLIDGSVNNGPTGSRNTTNLIPAAVVHAGVFSQGYVGEAFGNVQLGWILGGNKNIASIVDFDPKTGIDCLRISYDSSNNELSFTSTNRFPELAKLFPTCCIIKSDLHINELFYTGGLSDWSTLTDDTTIYTNTGGSLSVQDCPESMTKSCATFLPGTEMVLVNGGLKADLSDSKDSSFMFNVNELMWYETAGTLINKRRDHQMVILDGGPNNTSSTNKWVLVVGGKQDALALEGQTGPDVLPVGVPVNKCELLYVSPTTPLLQSYVSTGSMGVGRYSFGMVKLPDNRVLVCGGIGYDPSYPVYDTGVEEFNYELQSCEIYDPKTGQWSPASSMLHAHSHCVCQYIPETNKVFVYGGYSSSVIEYLDLETMSWHVSDYLLNNPVAIGTPIQTKWCPALIGGGYYNTTTDVFTLNNNVLSGSNWNIIRPIDFPEYSRYDGLNGEWRVESYDQNEDTWTLSSNSLGDYTNTDVAWSDPSLVTSTIKFNLIKSVPYTSDPSTSYIFDKSQPFSIGKQRLLLNQDIKKGISYNKISVISGAFELTEGYLLFNYGYQNQAGPVKFFTTTNDNTIVIDANFKFRYDIDSGTVINILYQRALFESNEAVNGFWVTASNAGRTAAIDFIKTVSAAGIDQDITTRYPGDRGLGNEGYPTKENYKINEIAVCFGQDDIDAELTEIRQSEDQ